MAAALFLPAATHGGGVVTSATESALNSALSGGGTVTFACNGVINISGTKTISANTVLDATGYGVTISGQNNVQLFVVNSGVSLTLVNLTLANGKMTNGNGGAVHNSGTLTANYCAFTNNTAWGTNGVDGAAGTDNPSGNGGNGGSGTAGASAFGGAIYNSGTLSLLSCVFQSNSVAGGAGGAGGRGGSGHGTFAYGGNGGTGEAGGSAQGGAVYSTATLLVSNCYFYASSAAGGSGGAGGAGGTATGTASVPGLLGAGGLGAEGSGAGIYCAQAVTVSGSTFYGNSAQGGNTAAAAGTSGKDGLTGGTGGSSFGGGICTIGGVLTNCTFYWNSAGGGSGGNGGAGTGTLNYGGNGGTGGTGVGGGLYTSASLWVVNCTLTSCGAWGGAGGLGASGVFNGSDGSAGAAHGGDLDNGGGTFSLKNSIVATNLSGGNGYGAITDAGNNLSSDASITLNGTTSHSNTDPKLAALAYNGGFTPTCALLSGSPAINTGDDSAAPLVDQRGYLRSGTSDIGAYEYGGVDRDYTTVEIIATNSIVVEGSSVSAFIIYRDTYATNTPAKTVYYSISGTASNGVDYVALSNSCVIPGGHYAVTNVVTPVFNAVLDGTKTVTLTLQSNITYAIGSYSNATIWLLDDVPSINVTASAVYALGTNAPGQFTLTRAAGAGHALTVNYVVSGTAQAGSAYIALPAAVTFATNQTSTNLLVTAAVNPSTAQTVVLTLSSNADYFMGANAQAVVTLLPISSTTNSVASPAGRYWRGSGSDPTYWSIVVPLDYETGTVYDNVSGNCAELYPGLTSWTNSLLYHYNATNSLPQTTATNRIAFNNPIVAFGERVGGTPLYLNQDYRFGVYAGEQVSALPVTITVFARSNLAVVGSINVYPPDLNDTNSWNAYTTNGFQATTNAYGLATTLSDSPSLSWGAGSYGAYVLNHTASAQATNYYYLVGATGYPAAGSNAIAIASTGGIAPSLLYTLEFEQRPAWRSVFIEQPHFDGSPLPPFYAGKTLAELLTNAPPVTNAVALAPSACTNLDGSPELRRHPLLDQFVADMQNDPIALANYVLNEIEVTDAMDYNENGNVAENSINLGGVSRGALGTFLEKQGSPTEQCALLIYLFRQAGVPACYVFPPHNGMKILDARLSRMLKFHVQGGFSEAGQLYTTNTMIAVNYPWVAAYIGTNWVHLFPWLKDYEINEGLDLYDYMPTNYSSAYPWVRDYVYGSTNLLSLAVDGDNTPRVIFPRFLAQTLQQNHPGVSVDDLGVQIADRRHYYARWQDFLTPTWVTNTSTAVESLTASGITNVNPAMTNIFDTLSVEIYSVIDPSKDIQTGDLRLADLHNRKFYLTQSNSSPGFVQLSLVLAPYRTNITSQGSFGGSDPTFRQVLSLNLDQFDDPLTVRFKLLRHRALAPSYGIDPTLPFLGLGAARQIILERPLRKGDVAALCLNYGQVTRDMLNLWATDLWQMESALQANPSLTNSISADVYQGTTMYLCGMSYYEKVSQFEAFNRNLHKINRLSSFAMGLSKISPNRDNVGNLAGGAVDPVLPNVDMFFYDVAAVGNGTLRPDSGWTYELESQNCDLMTIADASAEEHQVLNRYYQQTNALSTVRMLQLAGTQGSGIVALNVNNYVAQGQTLYQGKALQAHDPALWQQVVSAFQNAADGAYVTAYMTPGPITNSAYKGMGALVLGWGQWLALITPGGLNGAFGVSLPGGTIAQPATANWSLSSADDLSLSLLPNAAPGAALVPAQVAPWEVSSIGSQIQNYVIDPGSATWAVNAGALMGQAPQNNLNQTFGQNYQACEQGGLLSTWLTDMGSQVFGKLADLVNTVSGEFYVDETDLQLPGPIPLALRRNYSSLNQADNQFGPGWKLSIMPYLSVSQGGTNIYAADMDGAVLAYVRTATNANVWLPTLAANPQLNNNTTAGVGGLVNRLRDRLVQSVNGSITNYTLYGADWSVRAFQVMSFNNNILNQTRPYLLQWTDNRGNYYTFAYGSDTTQPDFGQVRRILCSNGNYLGFYYDIYGHIIEAYSGDGRRVLYEYDAFGDLVGVTLPDQSTRDYVYQHGTQAVTNGTVVTQQPYSTHLIVEEDKPDGRALVNAYDSQRRVTNQLSTAGADLTPVRTASFVYANNFNLTNSYTNTISGYTLVIDGNNHTNRYNYTNGLITQVTDPLGQTLQQTWYADNATAPGYPRSVSLRADKRGLATQFFYDSNGNVTNSIVTGDLTGDGIPTQTATNSAVYNANCLPLQITDPAGNSTVYVYDPTFTFLPQQVIRYAGATPVSTNFIVYGSVTNIFTQGSTIQTNLSCGLALRNVRAYGSSDAATVDTAYDGHGFPTQMVRYTGTSDPAVTNSFFYNERGQRVDQVDSLGALTHREYDAMDRPTEQWNVDEYGSLLSWSFNYYNENGELTWVDGPAYNPEDYVWRDYDGAGRLSTEIHWRAEAKPDGSGVGVPPADNLYSQTFYEYDVLGNLIRTINPRGVITTNVWDALNRLVKRSVIETNGNVLTSESVSYEPGGLEHFHTNALGGFAQTEYTTAGQPKYRSSADGSTNGWRYYLDGRLRGEYQRNGAYWETTYDDANLAATRVFYSGASIPLATNVTVLDRRGNVIQRVDAAFNLFTNLFDGLHRLKVAAGPATATVSENCMVPGCGVYVTNILQQVTTRVYDAANRVLVVSNALGEKTITTSDMLGRPLSVQTFAAGASTALRVTSYAYSADHHSVTVTEGSGAAAVATTTFTDNDGHCVLAIGYPSSGAREYTLSQFDLAGNRIHEEHDSSGGPTVWTKADYTFDGLNRMTQKSDRDGAATSFGWDAAGNPTSRLMPGGLQWTATYNNASQILQEWNAGVGGIGERTNSYAYYSAGDAFAGLLQTRTDGRGVIGEYTYDDFLRQSRLCMTSPVPGVLPQTTSWFYDARGVLTNITENTYAGTDDSVVLRTYDAYRQLISESVSMNDAVVSSSSQGWSAAGRRVLLSFGPFAYTYSWCADGLLAAVATPRGSAAFTYSDAGQLLSRTSGPRITSVTSRDGTGRPLSISTTVNAVSMLSETLAWTEDGLLQNHVLQRADFTDSRSYIYTNWSRRVIEERLNLDDSTRWTNLFTYDGGLSAGPGALTRVGQASSLPPSWSGTKDAFTRISTETNATTRFSAYGRLNGAATLTSLLDGQPTPIQIASTYSNDWPSQWRTTFELKPGAHQLHLSAAHPSGMFVTNASVWFTNSAGNETVLETFDGAGLTTLRVWRSASGAIHRTQSLTWDLKQRLTRVTETDAQTNGYNWVAYYDGLGRRFWSAVLPTVGGTELDLSSAVTSCFDPANEFLELGVGLTTARGGPTTFSEKMLWKLYGPDLNGAYGGQNGTGGLEAVVPEAGWFSQTISDARGNILGVVTNGTVVWNPSRPTGYGAVPGYRPVALGGGASLAQASAWRGRWPDITGYIWLGARYYDPVAGSFLSSDPAWTSRDPNYYSFCGGDPINYFDADGRCVEQGMQGVENWASSKYQNAVNAWGAFQNPETRGQANSDYTYGQVQGAVQWATETLGSLAQAIRGNPMEDYLDQLNPSPSVSDRINGWMNSTASGYGINPDSAAAQTGNFSSQAGLTVASMFVGSGEARVGGEVERLLPNVEQMTAAEEGRMANLHYYSPESLGQETPHFSVETLGEGGMHTHQVITGPASTTMVPVEWLPSPTGTIPVSLADPAAAQALQGQRLGAQLGPYNMRNNNCLTTAADILRAGGADIPANNVQLRIWVKGKLQ